MNLIAKEYVASSHDLGCCQRVADHDVQRWAALFLESLASAPEEPHRSTRSSDEEMPGAERANRADLRASDDASEQTGEQ